MSAKGSTTRNAKVMDEKLGDEELGLKFPKLKNLDASH
jgi:hypothetical protein